MCQQSAIDRQINDTSKIRQAANLTNEDKHPTITRMPPSYPGGARCRLWLIT
ncbi:MAG: hypothetical protein KME06_21165 [Kastovskya adunca ATA6-11-RM4]|nr:hypothetical protein [Kastovskya adunca ATA6-11-RM4]